MERVEVVGASYEVYCHHCRVSFPVEARRCIHCGGRLAPRGEGAPTLQALPGMGPVEHPDGPVAAPPVGPDDEDLEGGALLLRRFGGLAVWALIALSAVLSNLCRG